jgi:hypothetical protein
MQHARLLDTTATRPKFHLLDPSGSKTETYRASTSLENLRIAENHRNCKIRNASIGKQLKAHFRPDARRVPHRDCYERLFHRKIIRFWHYTHGKEIQTNP